MDIEILANSDDNDPFPTLWDAVLVKRIEVRDESVSKSFFRILKVSRKSSFHASYVITRHLDRKLYQII